MDQELTNRSNTLGTASLGLGLASVSLVFGIGLCALTGAQQGWLAVAGTPLFVCGASSGFLGLLAILMGLGGLIGKGKPRSGAIAGLLAGAAGLCLFLGILSAFSST